MRIRQEVLNEAEFIKKEGGEIPEVYFWNSYFYLTEPPPKGLGLSLKDEEILFLKWAVVERYLEIIKRDLTPENIGKSFYRGIKRAVINLKRMKKFIKKEKMNGNYKICLEKIENWIKIFSLKISPNFGEELKEELKELEEELNTPL